MLDRRIDNLNLHRTPVSYEVRYMGRQLTVSFFSLGNQNLFDPGRVMLSQRSASEPKNAGH